MLIEKKYLIAKTITITLSCLCLGFIFFIGTYLSDRKEEGRQEKIIRGSYIYRPASLTLSLDDEKSVYYIYGKDDINTSGNYEIMDENVFELISGDYKGSYVVKSSDGSLVLIKKDKSDKTVIKFEKIDNQVSIKEK